MDSLKENPILGHITTFGGHPVSCASALATLNIILEENLAAQVTAKENLFRRLLVHGLIKEVRGKGLMLSLQLESFNQVQRVSRYCEEKGIMIDWFLHCETALRIAPPLIITENEITRVCEVIIEALNTLEN
jgi:acetylornithine/succinyldiaminopimelate/putrescine aminotransferase